jgi:hypothetical protein
VFATYTKFPVDPGGTGTTGTKKPLHPVRTVSPPIATVQTSPRILSAHPFILKPLAIIFAAGETFSK